MAVALAVRLDLFLDEVEGSPILAYFFLPRTFKYPFVYSTNSASPHVLRLCLQVSKDGEDW